MGGKSRVSGSSGDRRGPHPDEAFAAVVVYVAHVHASRGPGDGLSIDLTVGAIRIATRAGAEVFMTDRLRASTPKEFGRVVEDRRDDDRGRMWTGMRWRPVAGAVAAAVAAWQLWRIRVDALDSRAAEIASVALVTTVVERPTNGDVCAGRGAWVYEYRVHNPGRLPISDVRATITFPCEVQRLRYDGTLDTPTRKLELRTHVVAPGESHGRRRTLLIDENDWSRLSDTRAVVTFHTPDAGEHTTHWPARRTTGSSSVRRRLSRARR
jgi:hypothetical protein